jgi:hypothetical protein
MSEPDRFDEEVAEMLPCEWGPNCFVSEDKRRKEHHVRGCQANSRPAVAARLRANAHELEQAKEAVEHLQAGRPLGELVGKQTLWNQALEIEAQLAVSEKDRQRLIDSNEHWHTRVTQLKADNDAYEAQLAALHGKITDYLKAGQNVCNGLCECAPAGGCLVIFNAAKAELCAITQEER